MDQDKLNQKTHDQLANEKLQAEIDILHARLKKEFPDKKPPGRMARLADFAKQWSAFILGSVALFSAVFGVFVPLSEYLVQQRKALEYDLNGNMIGFVNDLKADDPAVANRSIMMLSYYETNSIPILLFFLEDSENNQQEFRQKIIETVSRIYSENKKRRIVNLITQRLEINFENLQDEDNSINPKRLMAMYNFMDLIEGMKLTPSDEEKVEEVYNTMKERICADEELLNDDDIKFGLFSLICLYLGVEEDCT